MGSCIGAMLPEDFCALGQVENTKHAMRTQATLGTFSNEEWNFQFCMCVLCCKLGTEKGPASLCTQQCKQSAASFMDGLCDRGAIERQNF